MSQHRLAYDYIMRIGIIGAGMIGSTLAKLWADAGHEVILASRHPDELQPIVQKIGARAVVGTPLEAIPDRARDLTQELENKIVLDTGNAYALRDGTAAIEAAADANGSAGWAAAMFPGARWVKAFNTVYFKTLESEAHRDGDRVGIPLASDDAAALDIAAELVRDAGFDPVIVGPLARGKEFEPVTPMYNTGKSGRELREFFSVG